ncbi:MAG: hypothetical protein R3B47_05775 [Bacteroidia bacterium]
MSNGTNYVGGYPFGESAPVAAWPNGFNAFYCMKYEISEQQWVDFFNSLTYPQQIERDITDRDGLIWGKATDTVSFRCTIAWYPLYRRPLRWHRNVPVAGLAGPMGLPTSTGPACAR